MNIEQFRNDLVMRMRQESVSQLELESRYGVAQWNLSRFLAGKRGISGKYLLALWPFVYGELPQPLSASGSVPPQPAQESEQA